MYKDDKSYRLQGQQYNPNEYTYIHGMGFIPVPEYLREKKAIRYFANSISASLMIYFILILILPSFILGLFSIAFPALHYFNSRFFVPDSIYQISLTITSVLSLLLPLVIYLALVRVPLRAALPMKIPDFSVAVPAIFLCLGVSIVGASGCGMIQTFLGYFGIYTYGDSAGMPVDLVPLLLYSVNSVLIPPFLEEFLFRGAILQSLRRFGDGFALLLSSAVFAAVHLDLVKFPLAFLMGLCMGYFVLRTGSLWTSIGIHFVNNAVAVLTNIVFLYLPLEAQMPFHMGLSALLLLGGLIAFLFLACRQKELFWVQTSNSVLNEKAKLKSFFSAASVVLTLLIVAFFTLQSLHFYPGW